jgi:oxaloacetate decarboxylase alpha subunit
VIVPHIDFLDETLRDGQQSLWGMRMQAAHALPVAETLDRTGFSRIDLAASSFMEVLIKFLREDPWEGLDLIMEKITRTPTRGGMRSNAAVSMGITPPDLMDAWMRQLNRHGVRSYWIYDVLYNFHNIDRLANVAKEFGSEIAGTVFFTESPIHTDDLFADQVRQMAAIPGVDTILFYDTAGVLLPDRIRTLIPRVVEAANGKPVEMHSNNLMGTSALAYCEAIKHGVTVIHTASRPMANGPSVPSTEVMVRNVETLGYTHSLDTSLFAPVAEHMERVGTAMGYLVNQHAEYDLFNVGHQVPGGMTGTLKAQLAQYGMSHRLDEVFEETARVRRELGYPIMATPVSQLVGIQAVLNIVTGDRYSVVPTENLMYAAGYYGNPPAPIDPEAMDRMMANPRWQEVVDNPPEEPSIEELRKRYDTNNDDELILKFLVPETDIAAMRAAGPVKREFPLAGPQLDEVRALLRTANSPYLRVATDKFDLQLHRQP